MDNFVLRRTVGSVSLLGLDEEESKNGILISEHASALFELGCLSVGETEKKRALERLESDNLTSEILRVHEVSHIEKCLNTGSDRKIKKVKKSASQRIFVFYCVIS